MCARLLLLAPHEKSGFRAARGQRIERFLIRRTVDAGLLAAILLGVGSFMVSGTLERLEPRPTSSWIGWVGLVVVGYCAVSAIFVVPAVAKRDARLPKRTAPTLQKD